MHPFLILFLGCLPVCLVLLRWIRIAHYHYHKDYCSSVKLWTIKGTISAMADGIEDTDAHKHTEDEVAL